MKGNNTCAEALQAGRRRVMFKTRGNFIRAVIFSLSYKDSYFCAILHRNCYYVQHTRKMWFLSHRAHNLPLQINFADKG